MKYIAYCTKGLERIVQKEIIQQIPEAKIVESGDKRVIFETDSDIDQLTQLRTVDDIGFVIKEIESVSSIEYIPSAFREIDLLNYKKILFQFREINNTFSVTASIVGSKIQPKGLISEVVSCIARKYQWDYAELDHSNFDIRIFIDHKTCLLSVRLTQESLHHRKYKTVSRIGSLKPTVAAAMVLMATKGKKGLKVVDSFCGSGTILCEARELGNEVYGGDINPESIVMTKTNLANLGYNTEEKIKLLDATKTNWPNAYFDCALSNLPWDKQIEVKSITDLYIGSLREFQRILKPNGSLCLLVSKPELLIKHAKSIFPNSKIESYKIGLLGQNPTIVVVRYQ